MLDENGPSYFVAFHSPGPAWIEGTPYNEQPRFMDHANYISRLHDEGRIVVSGPFMETLGGMAGTMASGGMAILKAADLEEATKLGTDDPTVVSGMLKVDMKIFWVPFHD
ncbi:MAG: YciI family protein [Janthinobacterium lividum]